LQFLRAMSTSWMLERLEHHTWAHHVAADAPRIALLRPNVTRAAYLDYLTKLYSFEAPVETALAGSGVAALECAKPRAAQLRADLLALGQPRVATGAPPMLRNGAEALGWLYVVERCRLLHGVLHRQLAACLPHEMAAAGSYLAAQCGTTAVRWDELGATLDAAARSTAVVELIAATAHAAFRRQRLAHTSAAHAA
jgi:heme oxygenase